MDHGLPLARVPTRIQVSLLAAFAMCFLTSHAQADALPGKARYPIATYSQKTLLKNWALSVCLARVAQSEADRADANAAAGGYLEFGRQPIEAYTPLRELALRYAQKHYEGSIPSDFNTMKCIDLFHSKELDALSTRLARLK